MAISVKDKDIISGPWKNISVDDQASLLHPLPLPLGGVVVIGYETISYYNKDIHHAIDPPVVKVCVNVPMYVYVYIYTLYIILVDRCLATKVFIGKLPAT